MADFSENCSWTQERIEAYVDGGLHGAVLERFELHIASCESCRSELSLAEAVAAELRALPQKICPERVVEEAAARAGAGAAGEDEAGTAGTWLERLRKRFGGRLVPLPKPAAALVLVLITAAAVLVLSRHERPKLTRAVGPPAVTSVTEKELELAKLDVMLAFAYVEKYSKRSGEIVKKEIQDIGAAEAIGRKVFESMYPFPLND